MRSPLFFSLALLVPSFVWAQNHPPHASSAPAPVTNSAPSAPAPSAPPASPTEVPPSPTPTVDLKNAPKIFSAHPNYDFHMVDEGPDIVHEFHIKNKGRSALKITNVGTSCGCTAAVLKKSGSKDEAAAMPVDLPPGGSGVIKATYHTQGRPGHATKIITVSSNDPLNPGYQLKLDMTVVREVDTQPDRLYLYGIHYKQPHETNLKILGKPGKELKVLSVETSSKVVTVTSVTPYTDPTDKRTGADITISLPPTQAIGSFTDEITIKTDSPKKPEIKVPVLGEVVGRVQYNPKNFNFAPNQDAPVTVQITADPPKGFEVRGVSSVNHLTRPYILKTPGGNGNDNYSLVVSVVKNLPKDSDGKDQVVVKTNDADQPELIFDVQAQK